MKVMDLMVSLLKNPNVDLNGEIVVTTPDTVETDTVNIITEIEADDDGNVLLHTELDESDGEDQISY